MENKVFGIREESLDKFINSINNFTKGKKVFAVQTHIIGGGEFREVFYAVVYYEYDNNLSNEKPNYPYPSKDKFIPASSKQVFSLVKNYGYKKEDAEKLSMNEAYQIIKEKKRK